MLLWIWMPLAIIPHMEGKLLGDHICQIDITVPQEVLKWELRNRTTRTYKWCMNVPPRCSVYSNKLVNVTMLSIINVTKSIEACCEGFKEQNNICVSRCQNCQNGLCIKESCICHTGWDGPKCDSPTANTTTENIPYSESTTTKTTIQEVSIFHYPAVVLNETTTTNDSPTKPKEENFIPSIHKSSKAASSEEYVSQTQKPFGKINATSTFWDDRKDSLETYNIPVLSTTPRLETRHPILEDMLNIYNAYMSTTTPNNKNDLMSHENLEGSGSKSRSAIEESFSSHYSSHSPYFDTTITQQTNIVSKVLAEDNENFGSGNKNIFENIDTSIERDESVSDYRELGMDIFEGALNRSLKTVGRSKEANIIEEFSPGSSTTLKSTAVLTKPGIIGDYKDENSILKENVIRNVDDFIEQRYEKRSSMENISENTKLTVTEPASKNLIYSICAASLTTFLILVVLVTLYAVKNSRKKVDKNKAKKDIATVAVYTTSIFHSPLPDPPTFDNPTYLTTGSNGKWNEEKKQSIEVQEFNVVFQKPMKNPKLDCKQYVYDHPPSTGSYRASSEVDTLSQYNFSQKSLSGIILEPLYDEIPSNEAYDLSNQSHNDADQQLTTNIDPNSLYMNTCAHTKF